jgi:hypothetical protein
VCRLYQYRRGASTWRLLLMASKKHSQALFTQYRRRGILQSPYAASSLCSILYKETRTLPITLLSLVLWTMV